MQLAYERRVLEFENVQSKRPHHAYALNERLCDLVQSSLALYSLPPSISLSTHFDPADGEATKYSDRLGEKHGYALGDSELMHI